MRWVFLKSVFLIFVPCFSLSGCFSFINLPQEELDTAIVDVYYEHTFDANHGWADWYDDSQVFSMTDGELPDGMGVDSSGNLFGTPLELGQFRFEVTLYDVDYYYDYDSYYGWDTLGTEDSEWFTLFVTETSTNASCPQPSNTTTTEIYLCLGSLTEETVLVNTELSLDVNYYVQLSMASTYEVDVIHFTLYYDAESFFINADSLTSSRLREVATSIGATVSFDNTVAGELVVSIQAGTSSFDRSGRLLDIILTALKDLDQETYAFTLVTNEVSSLSDEVSLPEIIDLDGSLNLTGLNESEDVE